MLLHVCRLGSEREAWFSALRLRRVQLGRRKVL